MLGQDCYSYIRIGLAIRLLRNIEHSDNKSLAKESIKDLLNDLEKCGFEVSLAGSTSKQFIEMCKEIDELENDSVLEDPLAKIIQREFTKLESIVFAEALTKKIYVVPKRRFNTEFLMNNPDRLLKEGVFNKLSKIARHDFTSSCRCLLFGEATASAFHILRATEAVLKSFYYAHRKQKRLENPMWGPMVDQLKAKKKNRPSGTLLSSLISYVPLIEIQHSILKQHMR